MSHTPNFKRTKLACYTAYFTMSSIFCIPPLLFVTLRETFGISYTLLGTLVLVNFVTQLGVDLVFTFFSKHFNTKLIVRVMPLITTLGMAIYALIPTLFPSFAYGGLLLGTVIFSLSAGLSEALLSPTIAAIPSDNPQRDMSLLHSLYAFGVLTMVVIGTTFLKVFGTESWAYLMLFLAALPIIPAILFALSPMPDMGGHVVGGSGMASTKKRTVGLALCVGCIFFGSCAENAMSNWISGYMENALGIDKALGDILGVAMFAVLLGLMRIGYARFGKRIAPVLMVGMIGATACYLVAGLVPGVVLPFAACILTGLFTSMLWPGALIFMEENIPGAGVTAYALMAAGGDMGASVAPQLLGVVVDTVSATPFAAELGSSLGISAEQVGLKAGMLVTSLFPILGIVVLGVTLRYFRKRAE
ncbi:MAG: MFS transporter [Clostridia bacterium]|nr:MFS transporter [Clostridia bacterium]